MWGLGVCYDELAKRSSGRAPADGVVAFYLPEVEIFIEAQDAGMVVVGQGKGVLMICGRNSQKPLFPNLQESMTGISKLS